MLRRVNAPSILEVFAPYRPNRFGAAAVYHAVGRGEAYKSPSTRPSCREKANHQSRHTRSLPERAHARREVQTIPATHELNLQTEKKKLRVCAHCRVSTDEDAQAGSYELQVQHDTQLIQKMKIGSLQASMRMDKVQ